MQSKLQSIRPAEQLGASAAAAFTILCLLRVPSRLGLTVDELGVLLGAIATLIVGARASWQAWRSGDVSAARAEVRGFAKDPRIAAAFEVAIAKAADTVSHGRRPVETGAPAHDSGEDLQ